jgi:hypothetical protein
MQRLPHILTSLISNQTLATQDKLVSVERKNISQPEHTGSEKGHRFILAGVHRNIGVQKSAKF